MAQQNLALAAELAQRHPGATRRLGIDEEETAAWRDAARAMFIPYDEFLKVHPQSEGFTSHDVWDFDATAPGQYPLLLHFPYFDLYRKQVVKQADLVLAMHLRGDAFTAEEKVRNFAYYEALTVRDSSLSAATQAVIAAEVGHLDLAHDYLAEAALMDLADLEHNTRDGLHIAALAGTWIALVAGLGGMRERDGNLHFAPRLPEGISRLAFALSVRQRRLRVTVTPEHTEYQLREGDPLRIVHDGEDVSVSTDAVVRRATGPTAGPSADTHARRSLTGTHPRRSAEGASASCRCPGVGTLAVLDQIEGDLPELDVEMLGRLTQDVEGLVGGDPFPFHQDALRLADELPGDEGGLEVLRSTVLALVIAGDGECEACHRGQQESPRPVHDAERVREARIEDQRSHRGATGQGQCECAPHPELRRRRTEGGPAGVVAEFPGVEGDAVPDRIESGTLLAPQLARIGPGGHGIGARTGDDGPVVDEEHARGLAGLHGGDRQGDGSVQTVLDAARTQEIVGDIGEFDGRLDRRVLSGAGVSCSGLHGASLGRPPGNSDTDRVMHLNSRVPVAGGRTCPQRLRS
jgi:hypothetical protein